MPFCIDVNLTICLEDDFSALYV